MGTQQQQQDAVIGPLDPQQAVQQLAGGAMSLAVASVGAASFDEHRAAAYANACRLAEKALDTALAAAGAGPTSQLEAVLGDFSAVAQLLSERVLNGNGGAADGN